METIDLLEIENSDENIFTISELEKNNFHKTK